MANGVALARSSGFSISRVFSRAFGTIAANPLAALGIALLFGALPSETYNYVSTSLLGPSSLPDIFTIGLILAARDLTQAMVGMILSNITCGAFVRLVVTQEEGRRPSFADASLAGLRALFPLLALGLIVTIGMALGFMLLVVPGIILSLMWVAAPAVLVEEKCGIFAALGRSRTLADGAWGAIFGLYILVGAALFAFGLLMGWMASAFGGEAGIGRITHQPALIMPLLAQLVAGTVATAFAAAIYTSTYVELRNWKDGTPEDALAEIFG